MQEKTIQYQLLPPLSEEEMAALRADIQARGVQVPVEFDEKGNLLDGYHRMQICQELGIKQYPSIIRPGLNENEKIEHILALNLVRRHLTAKQREDLIAKLRKKGWSTTRIAEIVGITQQAVSKATQDTKSCNLPDRVVGKDGKSYPAKRTSIIAKTQHEARTIIGDLKELGDAALPAKMMDAKRIAYLAREHRAEQLAEKVTGDMVEGKIKLLLGDFRERGKSLSNDSVDLIFTDPPYSQDALLLWGDLSRFANRILKPNGMLITYTGAMYLPRVIDGLAQNLNFWWAGTIVLPGVHSRVHGKNVAQGSKPLLFYVREGFIPTSWIEDTHTSESVQKKSHPWQQSLGAAIYYIRKLVPPGGLVVDPFLGGGTTGLAARQLKRAFIGMEIDRVAFASAETRIFSG